MEPTSYEEQVYDAIVCPTDVCFDIGANIGDVSAFLAHRCFEVIAFEPVWRNYVLLCDNAKYSIGSIVPVNVGISDTEGKSVINVPNDDFYMGSTANVTEWVEAQIRAGEGCVSMVQHHITLTTIKNFLLLSGITAPDFMKIDVEGAEFQVLCGGLDMIKEHHPIMFIELFAPWEKAFGYRPWKPLSLLQKIGYDFLFMCPKGLVQYTPSENASFPADYIDGYNIVAYIPNEHADRISRLEPLLASNNPELLEMRPSSGPNII